jgi:L-ascorbate metabolism protein UlaG (beta-lactamase superfamily)
VAELATLLGWEGLNTCAQHIGGEHDYPFGRVKFTSATHGGGRMDEARHEVVYCGPAAGILYRAEGKTVYHLGDTGLTSDMALIGRHGVDVALVPIGGNYTMNGEDAAEAVRMIRPDCVVPMHYDTWPVIAADPQAFAAAVGETARVVVLEPGGVLSV